MTPGTVNGRCGVFRNAGQVTAVIMERVPPSSQQKDIIKIKLSCPAVLTPLPPAVAVAATAAAAAAAAAAGGVNISAVSEVIPASSPSQR
ncbi:hypothetical protein E2C01_086339 [Portunus trituberculatus]|uniref:Uncharacterized protein n=1 Tax=Portunus trituberculatus TaxID=210409 RepID=A0A5B7J554_PORTR|nr:hypothetical protein [Portunus trituberculatus]